MDDFTIDRAPQAEIEAIVRDKLQQLLRRVRLKSPFYRQRLADLPPDEALDLARLPVLTKDDLVANSPPESQDLLTGPLTGAYVFRSGGTTGAPKFSPFAVEEFRHMVGAFLRTYGAAGLRSGDRAANVFVCGQMYASFLFVNRMLEEMGCLNLPLTAAATPATVSRHLEMFNANAIMGIPSWVLEIVSGLSPQAAAGIEKVFYGGEHLYAEERTWLHGRLPNLKIIASGGYGAVDTGLMGYQCEALSGSAHHVLGDHFILEFVDAETGRPVLTGESGLILVTALDRFLMPLIRYQIGDMGRWIPGDCPCGRTMPRFELLGRGDDTLRIGYATIGIQEVLPAIAVVPGLTTCAQLVKQRQERKDQLTVRVERSADIQVPAEQLGESLINQLYQRKPDLAKLEENRYVWPTQVEILPPGGIERNAVTGKIRRSIDQSLGQD